MPAWMIFGFAFIFLMIFVPLGGWRHLTPLFGTDFIDFILEVSQSRHGLCLSSEVVCQIYIFAKTSQDLINLVIRILLLRKSPQSKNKGKVGFFGLHDSCQGVLHPHAKLQQLSGGLAETSKTNKWDF